MAFHGKFEHTLDAKNRLTVPAKFRSALAGTMFIVKDMDGCICVYPGETYEQLIEQALAGVNRMSPQARQLRRIFYGNASDTSLDGAGRIMLPSDFLEHAQIEGREVVVTGTGDALEIWDRALWIEHEAGLRERGPELTSRLGHPG